MTKVVVDSWAWIELFNGSASGRKVDAVISRSSEVWTSVVSLAEIVSKYRRKRMDDSLPMETLSSLSKIGIPSRNDAIAAGRIHAEVRMESPNFGLADSFVLQLARGLGAKVLTGDPDFRGLKEVEPIE